MTTTDLRNGSGFVAALVLAVLAAGLSSGCAVVTVATTLGSAAVAVGGAAVSVGGAVVGSTVRVAGKAVEKTIDIAVPGGTPAAK